MGKVCRVKVRTRAHKKRKGFCKSSSNTLKNINFKTVAVNTESETINNVSIGSVNIESVATPDPVNIVNTGTNLSTSSSSSHRKVQIFEASTPTQRDKISGNRIIDTEILSNVFSVLQCPQCQCAESLLLSDRVSKKQGLASLLVVKCLSCKYEIEFHTSKPCAKGFDINRRTVYAMRSLGHGHSGIEKFATLMNMPKPMTANNYGNISTRIANVAKNIAEQTMLDAASDIQKSVTSTESDAIVDTGVSCDGTWQRRGFSSLNGVFTVISIDNGKVLDVEPMSRSCKGCFLKQDLMKTDPISYAKWKDTHTCTFNYQGSASGMEPVGAKRVFERSINKRKLRYVNFLGDGDSKGFASVEQIYPGIRVKKLECVGHYQKRVGTRLRNLKKTEKKLGGCGRLTDAVIDRLQNFFGVAIRQNAGNLKGMKAGVLATLFHVASSKTNNYHFPHCPTGADSWCKFNADKVNGTQTYKPGRGLPLDVIFKVKPVFEDLSKENELSKCLHGKTQNANESFNGTVWERLPKDTYVSLKNLEFGVYDAVANYNIGTKASVLIYEQLGMIPGVYTLRGCRKINTKRLRLAEYRINPKNKLRRQILRARKLKKSDQLVEKEGTLYEAGGF